MTKVYKFKNKEGKYVSIPVSDTTVELIRKDNPTAIIETVDEKLKAVFKTGPCSGGTCPEKPYKPTVLEEKPKKITEKKIKTTEKLDKQSKIWQITNITERDDSHK